VSSDESKSDSFERSCPYNNINTCMASITSLPLDKQKKADCCSTENYDDCPMFLSKVLRRV
jgi:hypothetical protein